eukprot:TRINITY_DN8451_c0_g1_i1.p1 TRINITY_DN8451_c0_g1~~TRINITY_DN8451_c0_g1_i1.p1  ORF type:complete len:144 (-),score=9.89 TRINITY_DN8451_c0_g1_i1:49-432(-)
MTHQTIRSGSVQNSQSFNHKRQTKCVICNLNQALPNNNDNQCIILDTDCLAVSSCQSVSEELSLIGAYIMVLATISLGIACIAIGTKHPNFTSIFIFAMLASLLSVICLYAYNKYIPDMKRNNRVHQ